jgi:hypothetical protein
MPFDPLGPPNITPSVIVGEAIAGQAAKVRKQLETIIKNTNKSMFDIGDLLHSIKKNGYHEGTFSDYLDTLDIKKQRAWYLQKLTEVMEKVGIPREKYETVGIAKLRAITSLAPDAVWKNPETGDETPMTEFITGFVEKADDLSLEEIKQHVRTLKGFVGENDFTWLNISVQRGAMDNTVRPALELAKNFIGSTKKDEEGKSIDATDGAALVAICADYLSDPNNSVLPEEATEATEDEG